MGLEQVNQQQLGVLSNLAATDNLQQVVKAELERQTDTDNATKVQETNVKKAINGKTPKLGIELIAGLATKIAQTIMIPQKILTNLEQEYDSLLNPREQNTQDLVEIKYAVGRINKDGQNGGSQAGSGFEQGDGSDQAEGEQGQDTGPADIREYVGAYSQMLVSGGSDQKKKLELIESKLVEQKGVSAQTLRNVKVQAANNVRGEILRQIKQSFIKQVISQGKSIEGLLANKETQGLIDFAFFNDRLGGYDFGGLDGHLQGAVDQVKSETHKEMREFLDEALTQEVTKKALGNSTKKTEQEIEGLLKLGTKVGFDVQQFVEKIPHLKDQLGLDQIVNFEFVAPGGDQGGDQRERHRYQYTPTEEKELLTDKLRALYLRQAVYGDPRTILESQFKMVKFKNGLIKLGVTNFDEVETEGRALAKVKLVEMLREAFEERATYAKLTGPAWQMTEKKIKIVLKNLAKLGIEVTTTQLDELRDQANTKMFSVAEHELNMINMAIDARGEIAFLTSKRKLAEEILVRLADETHLQRPGYELKLSIQEAC